MEFELTKEQTEIVGKVRAFCEKEFKPQLALELDRKEQFPLDLYRKTAKLGFTSIQFPKEYGGQEKGLLDACLIVEEMCRADSSLGIAISCGNFGSELILNHGTKEQKNKYLPLICKGDYLSAAAFTEPTQSGSDITQMKTKATKHGSQWQINGTKTLITNATLADFIVVLTQTDPTAKPSHQGLSLFVVDKNTSGLKTAKINGKMGIRCSETGTIHFNNVKTGDLIGELNKGFYYSIGFLNKTRATVAAQAIGVAQGAWEIAFKHAKQRKTFGQPLLAHQLVGAGLADAATQIQAARWLTYRSVWLIDSGKTDPIATAMAKQYASRIATQTTDFAIQVLGGYGYLSDHHVERYHRDAKVTELYEGTSEIQKLTILKYLSNTY